MPTKPEYPLDPEELKRRLGVMHASYRAKVPGKIAEIEELWGRVKGSAPADPSSDALMLAVHTLVGSSPTLGCEELGACARELELALRKSFAHGKAMAEAESAAIDLLVAGLGRSIG